MGRATSERKIINLPDGLDLDPEIPDIDRPSRATTKVEEGPQKKTKLEQYNKYVSVPLTTKIHSDVTALAASMQEQRTEKRERITSNTLYRSLVIVGLELLKQRLGEGSAVNDEAELRKLLRDVLSS